MNADIAATFVPKMVLFQSTLPLVYAKDMEGHSSTVTL